MRALAVLVCAGLLLGAGAAFAGELSGVDPGGVSGVPSAGINPPGLLHGLFDTSRLHMSNTLVFSTSSGPYGGARSMNYTTLSYDASSALTASVTVGNRLFGGPRYPGDKGSMRLESLLVKYQPSKYLNLTVDVRGANSLLTLPPQY